MCTVTFIARRNGYGLGMNRNENLARVEARPPMRFPVEKRSALFPSEPNGGTWIGTNDAGITFALVNWYSMPGLTRPNGSRGKVVPHLLSADSLGLAREMLGTMPLAGVNPFRLIGIFPGINAVVEWQWNTRVLETVTHSWSTHIWMSSGYDEPGAQQARGKIFARALRHPSAGTLRWLRELHRSHAPEPGPYSICMHRAEAGTVSYTEVLVSNRRVRMRYKPGPPCCREFTTGAARLQYSHPARSRRRW